MTTDLDIVHLFLHASWVVKAVVVLLISVSVGSWAVILSKFFALRDANQKIRLFYKDFWSGRTMNALLNDVSAHEKTAGAMARIFAEGMRELQKYTRPAAAATRRTPSDPAQPSATVAHAPIDMALQLDGLRRVMRVAQQREIEAMESHLSFLASVASVSPYVGLFGTVWGIMHAFTGLAALTQVTLATVAPGIAEALIATALGLFAAIPAVVTYNRFVRQSDQMAADLDNFIEEFSNLLQHHLQSPGALQGRFA